MSSSCSSLDWILSHWAHFTVPRFICVCLCILCLSCHTAYALYYCNMVWWTWWDWSLILRTHLPSVLWHGWVIWPVKPVPDVTYNMFDGTLNLTQLNWQTCCFQRLWLWAGAAEALWVWWCEDSSAVHDIQNNQKFCMHSYCAIVYTAEGKLCAVVASEWQLATVSNRVHENGKCQWNPSKSCNIFVNILKIRRFTGCLGHHI